MKSSLIIKTIISFVVAGTWIGGITLLSERLGSKKGGMVTNLPSTILISLLFVALIQDVHFAARATTSVPIGMLLDTIIIFIRQGADFARATGKIMGYITEPLSPEIVRVSFRLPRIP